MYTIELYNYIKSSLVDFQYAGPTANSTCYCRVFKIPNNYPNKKHVFTVGASYFHIMRIFQREILINSSAPNLVYHLTLDECDADAQFDDSNLPSGIATTTVVNTSQPGTLVVHLATFILLLFNSRQA